MSTVPYLPDDGLALTLAGTRDFRLVDRARLERLVEKAELPRRLVLDAAEETAVRTREAWRAEREDLGLSLRIRAAIDRHMELVPRGR